jgi:hypothetical protein
VNGEARTPRRLAVSTCYQPVAQPRVASFDNRAQNVGLLLEPNDDLPEVGADDDVRRVLAQPRREPLELAPELRRLGQSRRVAVEDVGDGRVRDRRRIGVRLQVGDQLT